MITKIATADKMSTNGFLSHWLFSFPATVNWADLSSTSESIVICVVAAVSWPDSAVVCSVSLGRSAEVSFCAGVVVGSGVASGFVVGETAGVAVGVGVTVASGVGFSVGVVVGFGVAVALCVGLTVGVAVGFGVLVGLWVGVIVGDGVGITMLFVLNANDVMIGSQDSAV